ncbi:MAG: class I mannose-6-phosphate isomerase, partial [Clostridia bacterium]|nr:class I mannose-6-phosphate isomerase [Clostridia bacterium]
QSRMERDETMPILKLRPSFKDYIWGGTRLRSVFGLDFPGEKAAEAWVLSCRPEGPCYVEDGRTLFDVLGQPEDFPLLVKLIDASEKLSVQVHPDDAYARAHENDNGKTEMWAVLDAEPDAYLYLGFARKTSREEVLSHIFDNTLTELLRRVPVKKGDVFLIPAGTIHAIGAGCLMAEVQQNSNVTYRVYDYGRFGNDGQPRELYVEKALDVLDYSGIACENLRGQDVECAYFKVSFFNLDDEMELPPFSAMLCTQGAGKLNNIDFRAGDCLFVTDGEDIVGSGCADIMVIKKPL